MLAMVALWAVTVDAQRQPVITYTMDSGLPSNSVRSVVAADDGRVWTATRSGLAAFDGFHWEPEAEALPGGEAALLQTRDTGLWVAADRFSRVVLTRVDDGSQVQLQASCPELRGAVSTTAVGHDPQGRSVLAIGLDHSGLALHVPSTGRTTCVDGVSELGPGSVDSLTWDGSRFVAAIDFRVRFIATDGAMTTAPWADAVEVFGVGADVEAPGPLWVFGEGWFGSVEDGALTVLSSAIPGSRHPLGPYLVHPAPPRWVFFGDRSTLYRLDRDSREVSIISATDGLAGNGITGATTDAEGHVWIASLRGLSRLSCEPIESWNMSQGLLEDEVAAIAELAPGRYLVGHNRGLTLIEGRRTTRYPFEHRYSTPSARVLQIVPDERGGAWLVSSAVGLGHFNADGRLTWHRNRFQRSEEFVVSVMSDGPSRRLVLTNHCLYPYANGRFDTPLFTYGSKVGFLRWLTKGPDRAPMILTGNDGIWRRVEGRFDRIPQATVAAGANSAYSALQSSSGRYFLGTMAGVKEVVDGMVVDPPEPELAIPAPAYLLVEDRSGRLFVGGDDGVRVWDGRSLVHVTAIDGLLGREVNRGAGLVDGDGSIWIGTDGGVTRFHPSVEFHDPMPPRLSLVAIRTSGRRETAQAPVVMAPGDDDLEVHFRAVSFKSARRLRFSWRLAGLDPNWSQPSPSRSAHFYKIPPGDYTFQVRATDGITGWTPTESIAVSVMPPIYRRLWVQLALVGVVLVGGIAVVRMAVKARFSDRLRREVALRTEALSSSERRYRGLFEQAATPKLVLDARGTVVDGNESAKALGCDRQPAPEWVRSLAERLVPAAEESAEVRIVVNGETREFQAWCSRIDGPQHERRLVTLLDITERRRLEEARLQASKMESIGILAGGIAHDFNNALTAAVGQVSLARFKLDQGLDATGNLGAAEEGLAHARDLTSQLLTFSRGGAPMRELVDVGRLLTETANFTLAGSSCAVTVDVAPDLWAAEVDRGQLGQVVSNLLINADQACGSGGAFAITARNLTVRDGDHELPPGPYLEIVVADDGPGIPDAIRDRVFEPYFTTKEGGSGLGLATAFSVAKRHGGRLELVDSAADGTTFRLVLPARPDLVARQEHETVRPPSEKLTILVLDDEPDIRELYRELLAMLGHRVVVVDDGTAAVAAVRAGAPSFDLGIFDLTVPGGIGGREALAEIQTVAPGFRAVVSSGYSNDPVMADPAAYGFAGRIRKPFGLAELTEVLATIAPSDPGPLH